MPFFITSLLLAIWSFVPTSMPVQEQEPLRVLVWNVLRGGNEIQDGPAKALEVIREAAPDIVLLQESYDINGDRPKLGAWLAGELGWNQYQAESKHLCVLTPLEMEATFFHHEWHGVGAQLRDAHGRSLIAWTIWIDWRSFITYALRDNPEISDQNLMAMETTESSRMDQARALVGHLRQAGHLESNLPVLVGGDWNCPSHLDWTVDAARIYRDRRALPLPVSLLMESAGFEDAFREVHPNPVQHPGITWSPWNRARGDDGTEARQSFERIDRLYYKNPVGSPGNWTLRPIATHVLPVVWESDEVPLKERAFPSDHGALVVDLEWIQHEAASTNAQ
ncbi:MAG: endonuclease/exonuclease/phosphatase family protein [Phycisphaerales bacterium]|nr:endonuclease/exonuclease/phosphatase family protein [Phycisphaerales bacterium]